MMIRKINKKTLVYCFLIRVGQHWLGFVQLAKNSVKLSSSTKQDN